MIHTIIFRRCDFIETNAMFAELMDFDGNVPVNTNPHYDDENEGFTANPEQFRELAPAASQAVPMVEAPPGLPLPSFLLPVVGCQARCGDPTVFACVRYLSALGAVLLRCRASLLPSQVNIR